MSVVLVEVVNQTRTNVDEAAVAALCTAVLVAEGVEGAEGGGGAAGAEAADGGAGIELGVRFVGEQRMRTLNREYRGLDQVTDVLSFPLEESGEWDDVAAGAPPRLLGDIVACPRVAARQARGDGQPLAHELAILLIHGVLHLLGYDHETDDGEMLRRQAELLCGLRWEELLVVPR
ncbi:MAG: rRNA maturation RNase YbeY [Thermoleophilia bacterium]